MSDVDEPYDYAAQETPVEPGHGHDTWSDHGDWSSAGTGPHGQSDFGPDLDENDHGYDPHRASYPSRPAPTHRRRHSGRSTRSGGPRYLRFAGLLLAVLLVLVGIGYLYVDRQINPGGHRGPAVVVVIPSGASTSKIGDILASDGVIHNGTIFAWYVRLHGYNPLYPGTYSLPKNSNYKSVVDSLMAGPKVIIDKLVIPEGFTVRQIAAAVAALPGLGLSAQTFLADADNGTVRSPYEPAGVNNLEGLLFPATYEIEQGQTEVDVLEDMITAFDQRAAGIGLQAAASRLGQSVYNVIKVASIVEREAKLAGDRGPVASVIYNRLKDGMTLGADSTETYYLRLTDPTLVPSASQLNTPGPYNTRLNPGLPPTPISNPGVPSLQAAATPPNTNYLYFVEINPDGQLGYASSNAGFEQLESECRAASLC